MRMEFEDLLRDVGRYGKYQKHLIVGFLIPVTVLVPSFIMANLFLVSVPHHWCYVPEVSKSSMNATHQRLLIGPPGDPSCLMYNISYENFSVEGYANFPSNDTVAIACQDGWVYDKSNYESTAATKWNLVCDKSHYPSLIFTLQNVGGIIGTPIFSSFSDKYGRKSVYFITALVAALTNFLSPFSPDFTTFAVLRTIQGSIYPTILVLPYILVLEIVPPERRTRTSYIWNFSWMAGMCILPLIVYLSRSWTTLCFITSGAAAMILPYWRFIPESPRWLLSRKKYEAARDIMLDISKKNGNVPNSKSLLLNLQILGEKIESEEKEEKRLFYSFIKFPRLRKHFLILVACCFANHTIYSGIHYNISNLEGNEFLIFFLLALAEAPGCLLMWPLMEQLGRRWSATGGFFLAAIVCAAPLTGLPYSDIASSVTGKFVVAGLYMVTDQQVCELYPTVARSFGMGLTKSISSGFSFFLPYVIYLSIYGKAIPFVVISLICLMAGVMASFLPETLNRNLPQTIADAEEFGKNEKYFSFKRRKSL